MKSTFFQKYLLPGFIFQSLIIGGGYGTGRELVEFFLTEGPVSGLINMGVATVIWSLVLSICFEFALAYTPLWIPNITAGKGWIALALVVFSGWRPVRVMLGAWPINGRF